VKSSEIAAFSNAPLADARFGTTAKMACGQLSVVSCWERESEFRIGDRLPVTGDSRTIADFERMAKSAEGGADGAYHVVPPGRAARARRRRAQRVAGKSAASISLRLAVLKAPPTRWRLRTT
jgi:hypothetical protein